MADYPSDIEAGDSDARVKTNQIKAAAVQDRAALASVLAQIANFVTYLTFQDFSDRVANFFALKTDVQALSDAVGSNYVNNNTFNAYKADIAGQMHDKVHYTTLQGLSDTVSNTFTRLTLHNAEIDARMAGDAIRITYAEAAADDRRPGEVPKLFSASTDGEMPASLDPSARVVGANGAVAAFSASGVAPVRAYRIEPYRDYRVRFVVQRAVDTTDPAGAAVRLALVCLDRNKVSIGTLILATIPDMEVASGRQEFQYNIAAQDSDIADFVVPTGTVYARPYAYGFGDAVNHAEVMDVTDLTDAANYSPDLTALIRDVAGVDYRVNSVLTRIEVAEQDILSSHNAGWVTAGTLDDDRLSENVVLGDRAATITASYTFNGVQLFKAGLDIGAATAGGAAVGRVTISGNKLQILPTNKAGGFNTARSLEFDPDAIASADRVWTAIGGFKTTGNLKVNGFVTFDQGLTVAGALLANVINVIDKAATRADLNVYSKEESDALVETFNVLQRKGDINCASNPNYPAANNGHVYVVTGAGKIGGASGITVEVGDTLLCRADGSPAGTQAAVGANWTITQFNIIDALTGIDIGVRVQAYSAKLAAIDALTWAADKGIVLTGTGSLATFTLTTFARAILDDADAATVRATIGAVNKAGDKLTGKLDFNARQAVAAASTTDISAATSNFVVVNSGSGPIANFGAAIDGAIRVVQFQIVATITHDSTGAVSGGITLPGGVDMVTAASDYYVFICNSVGWKLIGYSKFSGKSLIAHTAAETPSTATGNISSTNVQSALAELDTEKLDKTGGTLTGALITAGYVRLPSYTVGTVPSAATAGAGAEIYVSNETGGAVTAFSDGTNWRRVTDRTVIS